MPSDAARLLSLAFDPAVQPAGDAVAERILDAALDLAAASGLRNLTMDDVARRARVGRMTVYRRFGSRAELVDALAVRECRRCLADISAALDPRAGFEDRVASLVATTLRLIAEHPLLARLASVEPEAILHELTRENSSVLRLVHEFLLGVVVDAQRTGELVQSDPALMAELAVRLGASFVLMPQTALPVGDERAIHKLVAQLLAPLRA